MDGWMVKLNAVMRINSRYFMEKSTCSLVFFCPVKCSHSDYVTNPVSFISAVTYYAVLIIA